MDTDLVNDNKSPKKRKNGQVAQEVRASSKKSKLFSAKEFRKKLKSEDKLTVIKQFADVLKTSTDHDYVHDYLENGGNCLELLQILENDSAIPPAQVFDLVTHVLLRVNANYLQYKNSTLEACRYLLNNYLTVVHKMIGLSSSKEERKSCVKLLTAMAAFSPNLAKDILLNVKFHSANTELLVKHTGEKDSVRDCFVRFVTAFLIDGNEHVLTILLERSGLLTGIINGLQYDCSDTLCVVITAMKNHILENGSVSKTTKMKVFNTSVVRDIVNLYNWRGPEGLKSLQKNNKSVFEVDKLEKSRVSECVHDFLITLCTSHKYGVVFRDPSVGLGRKNQNGLVYTVLESVEKPWEHSYASDLVLKICKSCPDLVKSVWSMLKSSVEPRLSDKWLTAMSFSRHLVKLLQPDCIEHCISKLNPQQIAQIIEVLASPAPILKILLPEKHTYEVPNIKQHISVFLFDTLEALDNYLTQIAKWICLDKVKQVKKYISNYICKNYPDARTLVNDWKELSKQIDTKFEYLSCILDILRLYKDLAPQLLYSVDLDSDSVQEFLTQVPDEEEILHMKIVDLFIDLDHTLFSPKNENFQTIFPRLLKLYHSLKSNEILQVLTKVLENTNLFEGCSYEIPIWLDGVLNSESFSDTMAAKLTRIVRAACDNVVNDQKELADIKVEQNPVENFKEIIEAIEDTTDNSKPARHRHFSTLILNFLKELKTGCDKPMKKYSEFVLITIFHYQTSVDKLFSVIQLYRDYIPEYLYQYFTKWVHGEGCSLDKYRGRLKHFHTLSEAFLNVTFKDDDFPISETLYPNHVSDVLQLGLFYFTNLVRSNSVTINHSNNLKFVFNWASKRSNCSELFFNDPNLINNFDILHWNRGDSIDLCTKTVYEVSRDASGAHLDVYRQKIYNGVLKIIKKPKKYSIGGDFARVLEVFGLDYAHVTAILSKLSNLMTDELTEALCYCFDRLSQLCAADCQLEPLGGDQVRRLTGHEIAPALLSKFSKSLLCYLQVFPHNLEDLDENLFGKVLNSPEYHKDNVDLLCFMLERNSNLSQQVESSVESLVDKKGVILPLAHVLINSGAHDNLLQVVYQHLEPSIVKALQKPQKVGQHFLKNYDIHILIEKFMADEKCRNFSQKIQKFEVTEPFHVRLLEAVYKRVIQNNPDDKQLTNIILTFIHLEMSLFKRRGDDFNIKIREITPIFNRVLETIAEKSPNTQYNETVGNFWKFCLKFGLAGEHTLLTCLKNHLKIIIKSLGGEEIELLLDQLLSHSEFLNVALGEHNDTKCEVLTIILMVCQTRPELMQKNHLPVLLAAYRARISKCDRTILALLKLYESKPDQTGFYSFKPFLWGREAATHYSVRSRIDNALIRQPKSSDVLDVLKDDLVASTIVNYPFMDGLHSEDRDVVDDVKSYDLKFMLPLFSHLLAPEQQVKTYKFTRCGGLSLTVMGLSSHCREVRQAACHVMSRFHFHLEARQTGKDNLLWIRFVEALCGGMALLPDIRLNSFAAVFFARMAMVLTQPNHVMYYPLSRYLMAKQHLQLDTVPELYTLLHSPEVNFKEHRTFVLEILRDGLRGEKDFKVFSKSMAFKLICELFSSCLSDIDTKLLILDVVGAACKLELGVKVLCDNHSLLALIWTGVADKKDASVTLPKWISILSEVMKTKTDACTIVDVLFDIVASEQFFSLQDKVVSDCFRMLYTAYAKCPETFQNRNFDNCADQFCKYVARYGCKYVTEKSLGEPTDKYYYLRLLFYKMFS